MRGACKTEADACPQNDGHGKETGHSRQKTGCSCQEKIEGETETGGEEAPACFATGVAAEAASDASAFVAEACAFACGLDGHHLQVRFG